MNGVMCTSPRFSMVEEFNEQQDLRARPIRVENFETCVSGITFYAGAERYFEVDVLNAVFFSDTFTGL